LPYFAFFRNLPFYWGKHESLETSKRWAVVSLISPKTRELEAPEISQHATGRDWVLRVLPIHETLDLFSAHSCVPSFCSAADSARDSLLSSLERIFCCALQIARGD